MQTAWWYLVDDLPQGPVSRKALETMRHNGEIKAESLVMEEGRNGWICYAQ